MRAGRLLIMELLQRYPQGDGSPVHNSVILSAAKDLRTDLTTAMWCSVQRSFAALRMTYLLLLGGWLSRSSGLDYVVPIGGGSEHAA